MNPADSLLAFGIIQHFNELLFEYRKTKVKCFIQFILFSTNIIFKVHWPAAKR